MKTLHTVALLGALFPCAATAVESCSLLTHTKLSIADFAESPLGTEDFYFNAPDELVREGTLRLSGRSFEVSFEDFSTVYECQGGRNAPCIGHDENGQFLYEARVDFAIGVVVEMGRQIASDLNPFTRGGVADSELRLWKIGTCLDE